MPPILCVLYYLYSLFQLEQKGKLQRLIAKDVSVLNFVCSVDSPGFYILRGDVYIIFLTTITYLSLQLVEPDSSEIRILRGHKLPVTCLVITSDDKYIFSAAKDCSIIKC